VPQIHLQRRSRKKAVTSSPSTPRAIETTSEPAHWNRHTVLTVVTVSLVGAWSYWPTITQMVRTWSTVEDYSHAFLVPPVAALIWWSRRKSRPAVTAGVHWSGLVVVMLAAVLRGLAGKYFVDAVDGWSLVLWIGGIVMLIGGWPLLRWAAPAVVFLLFMVPLPFRLETALSVPLQRIATQGSSWLLQTLGQPALPEGTRIMLGDDSLEIERACSGLRMFFGVFALAYVYAIFSTRPKWHKAALLVGTVPIAILANILRITTTGLLFQLSSNPGVHQFIHDSAGWVTILVAAAMLGGWSWYLRKVVCEVRIVDCRELIQSMGK
jgi:exosortase